MGMFDITPYGMGMPKSNQNFFGQGVQGDAGIFGLGSSMPAMPSDYSAAGVVGSDALSKFQLPGMGLQANGLGGLFGQGGILGTGMDMKGLQLGIGGLQTLGNLWGGYKSLDLANKQFDFSKMIAEKNLNNSTQSYNTALDDRITSRAKAQGMSEQDRQAYLAKNSLPK